MLTANANIRFTIEGKNYSAKPLRVVFSFGPGLLFSGDIISDHPVYECNEVYNVKIDFFTIQDDSYAALQPVLSDNMEVIMRAGYQILGIAELSDFKYKPNANSKNLIQEFNKVKLKNGDIGYIADKFDDTHFYADISLDTGDKVTKLISVNDIASVFIETECPIVIR